MANPAVEWPPVGKGGWKRKESDHWGWHFRPGRGQHRGQDLHCCQGFRVWPNGPLVPQRTSANALLVQPLTPALFLMFLSPPPLASKLDQNPTCVHPCTCNCKSSWKMSNLIPIIIIIVYGPFELTERDSFKIPVLFSHWYCGRENS